MARRWLVVTPILLTLAGALTVLAVDPSDGPAGSTLAFTFDGEDVQAPIAPALLRRRTITPEFDPPLDVRAGRVIFARGPIACDPGEVFVVEVVVTQGDAEGKGRTAGRCTGEIQQWTAVVVRRGGSDFVAGPAHACGVASTIRRGITDTFEWCADPVLVEAG